MKHWLQITLITCSLSSSPCFGATLYDVNIEKQGEIYILHIVAQINAEANVVEKIITDYNNLTSINPYLKESNIISVSENKRKTVNMLTHACVLFICYTFRQVQVFQPAKDNIVYGRIIPDKSDFKQGWSRWTVKEDKSNPGITTTQLIIDSEMIPDFFIFPIIGAHHLKKKIIEMTTETIDNLEKEARKKIALN